MATIKYKFDLDGIRSNIQKPTRASLTIETLDPVDIMKQAFSKYPLLLPSEIFSITAKTMQGISAEMGQALEKDQLDVFDALYESSNVDSAIRTVFKYLEKPKPNGDAIQIKCKRLQERLRLFELFVSEMNNLGLEFWAGDTYIHNLFIVMQNEAEQLHHEWIHFELCELYEEAFLSPHSH